MHTKYYQPEWIICRLTLALRHILILKHYHGVLLLQFLPLEGQWVSPGVSLQWDLSSHPKAVVHLLRKVSPSEIVSIQAQMCDLGIGHWSHDLAEAAQWELWSKGNGNKRKTTKIRTNRTKQLFFCFFCFQLEIVTSIHYSIFNVLHLHECKSLKIYWNLRDLCRERFFQRSELWEVQNFKTEFFKCHLFPVQIWLHFRFYTELYFGI